MRKIMAGKGLGFVLVLMAFALVMACSDADEFTPAQVDEGITADSSGQLSGGTITATNTNITVAQGTQASLADGSPAAEGTVSSAVAYYDGEGAVSAFGGEGIEYNGAQVDAVSAGAMSLSMTDAGSNTIDTLDPAANMQLYLQGNIVNTAARAAAQASCGDLAANPEDIVAGASVAVYYIPCDSNQLVLTSEYLVGCFTVMEDADGLYITIPITMACAKYVIVVGVIPTTGTGGQGGTTPTT